MTKFKSEIKKLPQSKIEIFVEIPQEEMGAFWDAAAQQLAQNLAVKGFRPGKIPRDLVEKTVGTEKFFNEAAELAVKKTYAEIVETNDLEPILKPEISILKISPSDAFQYKITVAVLPELVLPDYREIVKSMKPRPVKVEDKELEEAVAWLRESRAKTTEVSRPAKVGDLVDIDFEIRLGGVKVENGAAKKQAVILGSHKLIPGFEENLAGMAKGEEKEFSVEAPGNFWEKNLAGKKFEVKAKMNLVREREVPEANDEFARTLGKFEDMAAFKKNIGEGLLHEKEFKEKENFRVEMADKIAQNSQAEIPEILVGLETEKMIGELTADVEGSGLHFRDYLDQIKKTVPELKKEFQEPALRRVKIALILRQIGRAEKIEPKAEEVEEKMNEVMKNYPDIKAARSKVNLPELYERIHALLANEKIFEYLESLTSANK